MATKGALKQITPLSQSSVLHGNDGKKNKKPNKPTFTIEATKSNVLFLRRSATSKREFIDDPPLHNGTIVTVTRFEQDEDGFMMALVNSSGARGWLYICRLRLSPPRLACIETFEMLLSDRNQVNFNPWR
jgi:hypothetical protein